MTCFVHSLQINGHFFLSESLLSHRILQCTSFLYIFRSMCNVRAHAISFTLIIVARRIQLKLSLWSIVSCHCVVHITFFVPYSELLNYTLSDDHTFGWFPAKAALWCFILCEDMCPYFCFMFVWWSFFFNHLEQNNFYMGPLEFYVSSLPNWKWKCAQSVIFYFCIFWHLCCLLPYCTKEYKRTISL